ncbi:hypothetical protein [Bacillus testis]|uniref:hypothetical protein n=1 Tax=Bacillus testis TaxID=1622072 RepID=UPI000A9D0211|nr:hypothetical protein [Bacillus testis]
MVYIAFGMMLICMALAGFHAALSFNAGVFPSKYSLRRKALLFLGVAVLCFLLGLIFTMWQ